MKDVGNDDWGECVLIVAQACLPVVCLGIKDTGKNACATLPAQVPLQLAASLPPRP